MLSEILIYIKLGLFHVLDIKAYDHLLFLVLLTIPYSNKEWRQLLWLVTAFTLGHTSALLLDTYSIVSINKEWIEFLIPATIFVTGVFHIFNANRLKNGWNVFFVILTFVFGCIHGFGFSSYFGVLQEGQNTLTSLLGFAVGVEVGQIALIFIVLILAFLMQNVLRFSKKDWILVAASIVVGMTIPMLIETYPY